MDGTAGSRLIKSPTLESDMLLTDKNIGLEMINVYLMVV
jgi:hypothetical protein